VTFEIEPVGSEVKLTVTHDEFEPGSKVHAVSEGWPVVLACRKSLLETGRALAMSPQAMQRAKSAAVAGRRMRLADEAEGWIMLEPTFVPKTVYVTYIAATRETVWQALTASAFTQRYFFGRSIEIEPRSGGSFVLRMPDGRVDVKGKVVEWSPPRRLSVTWRVDWNEEMRTLPECLVTYDIEQAGGAVKLTVNEAHQWDVPDDLLSGGRAGWPAILSSLKSVLETGKALRIELQPPKEMMAALQRLAANQRAR
jgi:uncharacterized protein YndB with AHSA1/START domain